MDSKAIRTNQTKSDGTNILRHRGRIQDGPMRHLLDAAGTWTGQPQGSCRKEGLVAGPIPVDQDPVISTLNSLRH